MQQFLITTHQPVGDVIQHMVQVVIRIYAVQSINGLSVRSLITFVIRVEEQLVFSPQTHQS
ncbi:hypothetical protein KU73_22205 [Pectobacterium wasabiae]|uniref:Uncharacterized protein n=1 Tax=Pectobacterium wasabiae TaxID=55208 RepID=A0AAW3EAZ3_9GAMM|nr:hypothetical protein A7983_22685 [Pectobacterium wasabiae CFBP 3304]KFX01345.1 hypothetical protein JV38_22365 [Pectobacterium wasabiae]KGA26252.1 hypothetical protein KU73_22205 [Pectobacterium wasabiae]